MSPLSGRGRAGAWPVGRRVLVGRRVWAGALLAVGAGLALAAGFTAPVPVLALLAALVLLLGFMVGLTGDATTWATLMLGALFVVPARLVPPGPLRSNGSPALLIGLGMLFLWLLYRTLPRAPRLRGWQPVRGALVVFLLASGVAVLAGYRRGLLPAEASGTTRAVIEVLAFCGVALFVADGVDRPPRMQTLAFRTVVLGTFSSVVGALQFFVPSFSYPQLFPAGLLVANGNLLDDSQRAGLRRVAGTSSHPIEFGVTAAMLILLALHFATAAAPSRRRLVARLALLVLVGVLPMALSRGALLSLAVGGLVLAGSWSWRRRINVLVVLGLGVLAFQALVPRVLTALGDLFLLVGSDPSISGRTKDFAAVNDFFNQRPLLGRGLGTFVPEVYFFLDDQYLGFLIQGGLLLLGAFVLVLGTGLLCAGRASRLAVDPASRSLAMSLTAAIAALALAAATFDAWSFQQARMVLAVLLGLAGTAWRHAKDADVTAPVAPRAAAGGGRSAGGGSAGGGSDGGGSDGGLRRPGPASAHAVH